MYAPSPDAKSTEIPVGYQLAPKQEESTLTNGPELHVGVTHFHCDGDREILLVEPVAGSEHRGPRGGRLGEYRVDNVDESVHIVLEVVPDGNEGDRDAGGHPDGVLGVQVCLITSVPGREM